MVHAVHAACPSSSHATRGHAACSCSSSRATQGNRDVGDRVILLPLMIFGHLVEVAPGQKDRAVRLQQVAPPADGRLGRHRVIRQFMAHNGAYPLALVLSFLRRSIGWHAPSMRSNSARSALAILPAGRADRLSAWGTVGTRNHRKQCGPIHGGLYVGLCYHPTCAASIQIGCLLPNFVSSRYRPDAVGELQEKPSSNEKQRRPVPRSKKLGRAAELNQQYGVTLNCFIALNSLIEYATYSIHHHDLLCFSSMKTES